MYEIVRRIWHVTFYEKKREEYFDLGKSLTETFENKIKERNSNYNEGIEINEQISEEARILYVALTRTIRNCVWIKNVDSDATESWSSLLEG